MKTLVPSPSHLARRRTLVALLLTLGAGAACGGNIISSSGSGGSSSGGSSSGGSSSGGSSSGGSSSGGSSSGGVRVPKEHRPMSVACTSPRPEAPPVSGGDNNECNSDADCKAGSNGRCVQMPRFKRYYCSYDACATDAECAPGSGGNKGVCRCRVGPGAANVCVTGTCTTDADCGGNYCSPSQGSCGNFGGIVGFFCHSTKDECVDDSDCGSDGQNTCRFQPTLGYFKCDSSQCAG